MFCQRRTIFLDLSKIWVCSIAMECMYCETKYILIRMRLPYYINSFDRIKNPYDIPYFKPVFEDLSVKRNSDILHSEDQLIKK